MLPTNMSVRSTWQPARSRLGALQLLVTESARTAIGPRSAVPIALPPVAGGLQQLASALRSCSVTRAAQASGSSHSDG